MFATVPSFLTKIIIIIVIALIKTDRECIRKIGRKVATLPEPTGLSQEQQREHPSGLEGSLNSLTEALRKVIPECTHYVDLAGPPPLIRFQISPCGNIPH